ncbi:MULTISPECIES: polysaccharide deacetylase family protein [unclassified Roseobacter]|uniref:polysaccharide deacetylase family protein n=1 Tax=unclassified Roseobacter TaxID=196798 RepID=UPI0030EBD1BC
MKVMMIHDVRDVDPHFFPNRYKLPSFLSKCNFYKGLESLGKNTLNSNFYSILDAIKFGNFDYILTFDDGLKDHLEVAHYLNKKEISAIFFVPTDVCSDPATFIDSNLIQFVLASGPENEIMSDLIVFMKKRGFTERTLSHFKKSRWTNNTWSNEMIFVTRVLREFPNAKLRQTALAFLAEKYIPIPLCELHSKLYLSWGDIHEIHELGHFIGSHGAASFDYTFQSFPAIEDDLRRSSAALNRFQGHTTLSYPNGGCNETVAALVQQCGFEVAFTTEAREFMHNDCIFRVPRFDASKERIFR